MNNDDFKEVPDNIQDNNEETTNNIDNTNDNKANDYEDVCYICRRPESVAGKMIHIQPNLCICNDCMQKTFDSMSNGNFGNLGKSGKYKQYGFWQYAQYQHDKFVRSDRRHTKQPEA